MDFKEVSPQQSFPELEEEILKFWDENKIFSKSIENRKDAEIYSFFDGPPFATGTPHYGHIVASTIKDVVPRYWTMRGYKVPRIWGWDCHGLPIENIAEKELGIKSKKEIEEMGVDRFNETCRSKVLGYVDEWEKVIRRLGRWADMKNAYKTMDLSYMESVWWVFSELWKKDLIYESYRSMHICPRCETTLSQSEVAEGYKDIKDLSVIAKFELVDEPGTFILSWTTTPWTLIGNVALAVGGDISYVQIKPEGKDEYYILAKEQLENIIKDINYEIVDELKGKDLVGKSYKPLFDYYAKDENLENHENGWKIYLASFVTTEEGTGVVHIAPAYGTDDMNLANVNNLPFIQHVGMNGVIKKEAGDFAGLHVKPMDDVQKTDVEIIKYLAEKDLLFSKAQFEHSYPHCWRCDTPLINYATTSWFVKVTAVRQAALDLAKEINWEPKHIKDGRFGKWLEGAHDWSISRQRYWASCIPLWKCDKCDNIKVIGSVKELEDLSGQKITDLHKDKIDPVTFRCDKCSSIMRRIPDVLDTWFDSGSMAYAEIHYPFENKEYFLKTFPAEFIGEGVDQTRAWFYYLHIMATALNNKVAFKNAIASGIVLASDGKKMSKRLNNYPDPMEMFNKYGADAMRFYLLTSPVMAAENLNFSEKDMAEMSRGMFRMLWNSYSFFVLYSDAEKPQGNINSQNVLDRWIISELNILTKKVNDHMQEYELMQAARLFIQFIDNLSNWYLRRSRKRFKANSSGEKEECFATLYSVLTTLAKLLAPFAPFMSEEIYKNLTGEKSVHLSDYPESDENKIDIKLNQEMKTLRSLVEKGLAARGVEKIRVRQPLTSASIKTDFNDELKNILKDEINVKEILLDKNIGSDIKLDAKLTTDLQAEGTKNDLVRLIQDLRKENKLNPSDIITIFYQTGDQTEDTNLQKIISKYFDEITKETNLKELKLGEVETMVSKKIAGGLIQLGIEKCL